ncbi:hypothetical protein [Candidatus Poriferisodalis sp.]|uniref:hypothetical protein n=1 Tax=Candidatus Poriferisodalis sp. TaxID=3101277 RepID=UPI003C704750
MIDASIIDPIAARLDHHPGPRSRLTVAALLAAIVRNAEQGRPYTRAAVTETLNNYTADELAALGVQTADQSPEPFSQASVTRRIKQLEDALEEGWSVDGVKYDLDWFTQAMTAASWLVGIKGVPRAEAADSTTFPVSAELRDATADRGFASRQNTFASRGINVTMDYSDVDSAADEPTQSGSRLPRGRAAAQIAATAAAVAHNRQTAQQTSDSD